MRVGVADHTIPSTGGPANLGTAHARAEVVPLVAQAVAAVRLTVGCQRVDDRPRHGLLPGGLDRLTDGPGRACA